MDGGHPNQAALPSNESSPKGTVLGGEGGGSTKQIPDFSFACPAHGHAWPIQGGLDGLMAPQAEARNFADCHASNASHCHA